jgi:hypothetical protein
MISTELRTGYELDPADVERFRRDGFVHLRDVLSRRTLARYAEAITAKVIELNTMHLPMHERSTYDKAFLQVMNLWREDEIARELVLAPRPGGHRARAARDRRRAALSRPGAVQGARRRHHPMARRSVLLAALDR